MMLRRLLLAVALATSALGPAAALTVERDLQSRCDGYTYEPFEGTPPLRLMFDGRIRVNWLADHADYAAGLGFDGILIGGIMDNQGSDVWSADGSSRSVGEDDATLQDARRANAACRRAGLTHNFIKTAFTGKLPGWWDDLGWSKIHSNYRQAARFARAAGFVGICIDSEYVGEQYHYLWPDYTYDTYTAADLRAKVRSRAAELAAAMYDEFPDMEFFLVHADDAPLAWELLAGWVEEAARRDAPGGVHLGTEGTYTACSVAHILAHVIDRIRLTAEVLSPQARAYWRERCGVSPGGWPMWFGDDDDHAVRTPRVTARQFRAMMAGFDMAAAKYQWVYPAGATWWCASAEEIERYGLSEEAAGPLLPDMDAYYRGLRTREQVADPVLLRAGRAARAMDVPDADALLASLGRRAMWSLFHPDNQITRALVAADDHRLDWTAEQVERIYQERARDLRPNITDIFGLARDFSIIGPFDNTGWQGHDRVYPPEKGAVLDAAYEGMAGRVSWRQVTVPDGQGFLDFADYFTPTDWTVAYALCFVHSPKEQPAQIRTGANDAVKVWFNGRLVCDVQDDEGRWAAIDDDVVPVTLPAGRSTILVKVAQTTGRWAMCLRVTDAEGRPLDDVTLAAAPAP